METFTMTADEIYALKKEMKNKDRVIDDFIEMLGKTADKYKRLIFKKANKIEELNDELRLTRSENVLLSGLVEYQKDTDDADQDDITVCDSCLETPATRPHDGWELCDKCYLRDKYQE